MQELNYTSDDADDDLNRHVSRCRACWDARRSADSDDATNYCENGWKLMSNLAAALIQEAW